MRKLVFIALLFTATAVAADQSFTLQECIQFAIKNNPDLRIQNKVVLSKAADVTSSYGNILPNLSFGSAYNRISQAASPKIIQGAVVPQPAGISNNFGAGFSYTQNIYDGGRWRNEIKLAKTNYQSAIYDKNSNRLSLIVTVTEKFYNVLKAQELLKVDQKSLENSQEQLKKTEEMHRIGQVAKKDLYKAQVKQGTERLKVIQQEAELKLALADLKAVLGIRGEEVIDVYESAYQKPVQIDAAIAYQKALEANSDYASLQTQRQSAQIQCKIAKSAWYPNLSSSYSYSRSSSKFSDLYSNFDSRWSSSLRLDISFSLFNGFDRKTKIQQAKLAYQIDDDMIEKKEIEIRNTIQNLVLTLDTYRDMIDINELTIASAEEDLRLAQEMYRLSSATLLEVLDAQVALTKAQSDLISTKYDAKIAEARLSLVMGTLGENQ
ncbi:MAG: hypothetical protein COT43_02995 [Candidatus Marinimicrobia bacterium CG08_land_8_20_14_0_20_45_22]|nr:MAG: hypothetical protein COT43_02995 [Candidatus Marinimicrobia bacterium CG08_land_8_20_14_0_20_45_22]